MGSSSTETGIRLSPEEQRARTLRNRAIGLALAGLVVLFYLVTLSKLGLRLGGHG